MFLLLAAAVLAVGFTACKKADESSAQKPKTEDTDKKGEVKGVPSAVGGGIVTDSGLD